MSYILSSQREDPSYTGEHYRKYHDHLKALSDRFPVNAYSVASSDWWYSFDDERAPHDAALKHLRMTDTWANAEDAPQFCSITIELAAASGWRITITYPQVSSYEMSMTRDSGMHGGWLYDEFTLASDGCVVHTIEWGDGPVWIIRASDVIYKFCPDE